MQVKAFVCAAAVLAAGILPNAAPAATLATATADLNIRSGPGPEYQVIGAIPNRGQATIIGCIQDSLWCQVTYNGRNGWAYSRYLATSVAASAPVVIAERRTEIGIPTVTYETTGIAPAARVSGALTAGPVAAGTAIGNLAGSVRAAVDPPDEVRTYIVRNPAPPVYLEGEVVVGAGLPETVELRTIPDYQYRYVYVNHQPVLVEPASRRIVYVYR